jgi:hypothetical protein
VAKWYGLKEFNRTHLGNRKILCTVLHGVRSSIYHSEIQIGPTHFSLEEARTLQNWLTEACQTLEQAKKDTQK